MFYNMLCTLVIAASALASSTYQEAHSTLPPATVHNCKMPRRSGPKRLGHERCGVALTTPSPNLSGLRDCSSPPAWGGVCPHSSGAPTPNCCSVSHGRAAQRCLFYSPARDTRQASCGRAASERCRRQPSEQAEFHLPSLQKTKVIIFPGWSKGQSGKLKKLYFLV